MLDIDRDRIGTRPELGAVDLEGFALGVVVDHDQLAGHIAAFFFRNELELLDVVHDRVRLGLLVESRLAPVLGDVVRFSLGGHVVFFDQFLGQCHHFKRLGEGLDRCDRQRSQFGPAAHLEMPFFGQIFHIRQRPYRRGHGRFFVPDDLIIHIPGIIHDLAQNAFFFRF